MLLLAFKKHFQHCIYTGGNREHFIREYNEHFDNAILKKQ